MRQSASGSLTVEENRHRLAHMDVAPGSICLTGVLDENVTMAMDDGHGLVWIFQGQTGTRRPDPSGHRQQTGLLIGRVDYENGIIVFGKKFAKHEWIVAYEHGKA